MLVTLYTITSKLLLGSHLANKIIVNQFLKCWTTGVGVSAAVIPPLFSAYPVIIRTLSKPDDRGALEGQLSASPLFSYSVRTPCQLACGVPLFPCRKRRRGSYKHHPYSPWLHGGLDLLTNSATGLVMGAAPPPCQYANWKKSSPQH